MTTSSDSSVTRCETCGETFDEGSHYGYDSSHLMNAVVSQTYVRHPFVPAPAPSSDLFKPIGDEGTPLTMDHLASLVDGRLSGTPVLSPTEAGPVYEYAVGSMDGGEEGLYLAESLDDAREVYARWQASGYGPWLERRVVGEWEKFEEARRGR